MLVLDVPRAELGWGAVVGVPTSDSGTPPVPSPAFRAPTRAYLHSLVSLLLILDLLLRPTLSCGTNVQASFLPCTRVSPRWGALRLSREGVGSAHAR